jgi:hypothetical protein
LEASVELLMAVMLIITSSYALFQFQWKAAVLLLSSSSIWDFAETQMRRRKMRLRGRNKRTGRLSRFAEPVRKQEPRISGARHRNMIWYLKTKSTSLQTSPWKEPWWALALLPLIPLSLT